MKRFSAIAILCLLFLSAFADGKGSRTTPEYADSLRSVYLYTEGIKQQLIARDSVRARELFTEALRSDSTFAPAYYELAANGLYDTPEEAVGLARSAYERDTTNKWYARLYGQTLIMAQRYDEALAVYRRLRALDSQDPDTYRILSILYEQGKDPYSAIAILDSAELRFGRIPVLSAMKRRLLVATHQMDKAVEEARAMVEAVPYEAEHHTTLAELYGLLGRDSLALVEFGEAMKIDSTDLATLLSLADYYGRRQDYRSQLATIKRIFASDQVPLEMKVRRFEQLTSDTRFYREYYLQLNDLATTLAIRYPHAPEVVALYAQHLIASGELEQALELYKLHLDDQPPVEDYYRSVIDIESYLQRPDSVDRYVERALRLFPDKVEFHLSKGNVLSYSKQYDAAVKAYKNSLRYADSDSLRSIIWGMIGDTWQQIARMPGERKSVVRKAMKACYAAYRRSLGYDKDNTLVLNNYAYFLAEENRDLEQALAMSGRVVELTDKNPTYLDTHAWVLFKLGRADEARKVMQQAVALDSRNSPELLLHYGDILSALGEKFLAELYWRKALEQGYDASEIERRIEQAKKSADRP